MDGKNHQNDSASLGHSEIHKLEKRGGRKRLENLALILNKKIMATCILIAYSHDIENAILTSLIIARRSIRPPSAIRGERRRGVAISPIGGVATTIATITTKMLTVGGPLRPPSISSLTTPTSAPPTTTTTTSDLFPWRRSFHFHLHKATIFHTLLLSAEMKSGLRIILSSISKDLLGFKAFWLIL